jgi:hypothetical protein
MELFLGRTPPPVDIRPMPKLVETLAAELERPRQLPSQVVHHLSGTYGIDREAVGAFLVKELPQLQDYEVDLALAAVFTPTLQDQAVFSEVLGQGSVPVVQWPALIQQLVTRPTCAHLVTADGEDHALPLREVTLERYVHRLRLDATIPKALFKLISETAPVADLPVLKAIARRAIWEDASRREILVRCLTPTMGGDAHRIEDVVQLLKLAETYRPADVAGLLGQIPRWLQIIRQEITEGTGPKPFFNERVQDMHGGGRDQRRQDDACISAKESERAFLERLLKVLAG